MKTLKEMRQFLINERDRINHEFGVFERGTKFYRNKKLTKDAPAITFVFDKRYSATKADYCEWRNEIRIINPSHEPTVLADFYHEMGHFLGSVGAIEKGEGPARKFARERISRAWDGGIIKGGA